MTRKPMHGGFTLLELVFAIMILGIVSSIGSEVIVQVYRAYLQQRTVHNASLKTELAINQLANRLAYRIDRSVVARKPGQTGNTYGSDIYPLREVPSAAMNTHTILEWIGYDNDSFTATQTPGWSGYCNVDASTFNTLSTPGSGAGAPMTHIRAYYGETANTGAIIFAGFPDYRIDANSTYTANCMYQANGCMFPLSSIGSDAATFAADTLRASNKMIYTEFYRYAVSAFAVTSENKHQIGGVDVYDLHLHYGYQPWEGDNYRTHARNDAILLRNVSVFRFIKETNNIRIKLCVVEQVGSGTNDHYATCKEKAVIR